MPLQLDSCGHNENLIFINNQINLPHIIKNKNKFISENMTMIIK